MQHVYTPGGGLIAYTSDRVGHFDIWLINPQNGVYRQLTNGLGDSFSQPFWSPDSRKIAFIGKNRVLYIVAVASGAVARIDQLGDGAGVTLNWSPDSRKVAYTKEDLVIMYDTVTHKAEGILQPNATDVQWFPTGQELLFQAVDANGISQLFRIRTDGTGKQQITHNTGGPLHDASLSPDGKFVLYTTPGVSISLIHTVELATGNGFEVQGGPLAKNYYLTWSPDSMRIAYSATNFANSKYYSEIRSVGRKGENDHIWAASNCFATPVTWSPNGGKISYLSGCTEQKFASEMWVLDFNYPTPVQLLTDSQIMSLQWSPSPLIHLSKTKLYNNVLF